MVFPRIRALGPLLFTLIATSLSCVIQSHNLEYHIFADDTQIDVSLTTPDNCCSLNKLRDCLQDVCLWMKNSKLKLNAAMTEYVIISTSVIVTPVCDCDPAARFTTPHLPSYIPLQRFFARFRSTAMTQIGQTCPCTIDIRFTIVLFLL